MRANTRLRSAVITCLVIGWVLVNPLDAGPTEGPKEYVARANNPEPGWIPTLGVWRREKEVLVSASFPGVEGFTCDSWCYGSGMDLIDARAVDKGRLELRHRLSDQRQVILVTTLIPEPGTLEFVVRPELDPQAGDKGLPKSLPAPNLCWQLKRAVTFRSYPDPYPEFIKRCFVFTERGLTFLDRTTRRKIPCRPSDHEYNNPPWVQMYVGVWQPIPKTDPAAWADCSPDGYTTTVIGAVSRDGKHLAVLANDSATVMCQAWHDCLHNNAQWLPAEGPPAKQVWRVKIYLMKNDPEQLLARVVKDFPGAKPRTAAASRPGP